MIPVGRKEWSVDEVQLIVADYFSMLEMELTGKSYNKSQHRVQLQSLLNGRSKGSIEFKHQNISAVLVKNGLPYINGYKPLWKFQQALEHIVVEFLYARKDAILPHFENFASRDIVISSNNKLILDQDTPSLNNQELNEPKDSFYKKPFKINYLEREQMNVLVGDRGEELVLEYERLYLESIGRYDLAEKVERISLFDDSAGFDILSKHENGTDKYIEVKSTKLNKETPIFFSKFEYEKSKRSRSEYNLYRVFNLEDNPKFFKFKGCFDDFCKKEAVQYKGQFF